MMSSIVEFKRGAKIKKSYPYGRFHEGRSYEQSIKDIEEGFATKSGVWRVVYKHQNIVIMQLQGIRSPSELDVIEMQEYLKQIPGVRMVHSTSVDPDPEKNLEILYNLVHLPTNLSKTE